jgi:hypothetical protein
MDLLTILLIVLIVILIFGGVSYRYVPGPPYYSYGIGGIILVVILILILLRLLGRL